MEFYTNTFLHKGYVHLRGVDSKGKRFSRKEKCKPVLFQADPDGEYSTVTGISVSPLELQSTFEAKNLIETSNVPGREIYGSTKYLYSHLNQIYPGEIKFDNSKIMVANIDIEVSSDGGMPDIVTTNKEIISITIKYSDTYYVFGLVDYVNSRDDVKYYKCENESELLNKFLEFWTTHTIDVVTGWFIDMFDIPYIVGRLERVFGPGTSNLLSPWKMVEKRVVFMNGKDNDTYDILGLSVIDYMRAYKKFTYTQRESYRLDHIGEVELKEKKLDYSEYGTLDELYKKNPQKFIDYNIHDVAIVSKLDDRLKILNLIYTIAYTCKVSYDDAFGTVKIWECLIHNFLLDKKVVVPLKTESVRTAFAGGYVKAPQTGLHDWVVSFDYDSLYPHLIMTHNISPETIVGQLSGSVSVDGIIEGELEKYRSEIGQNSITASGHMYTREKLGFLPEIMSTLYSTRSQFKKQMISVEKDLEKQKQNPTAKKELEAEVARLNALQLALKYILNGGYGALSNEYFLWFDMRTSESITLSGQLAIKWLAKDVNTFLNRAFNTSDVDYVIAIDTDSLYLNLSNVIPALKKENAALPDQINAIDKFCVEVLQDVMNKSIKRLCDEMNAIQNKLKIKRETIAQKAVWTAKKKYALLAWDVEGVRYSEAKIKAKGLEMVRSSTPAPCRKKLEKATELVLTKTEKELQNFVSAFKNEFFKMSFEEISFPRGVNNLEKYFNPHTKEILSGAPQHVKAALAYNRLLHKLDLDEKYPEIKSGEKIRFCHMKVPNVSGVDVFACPSSLQPEFNMSSDIDYEKQFYKSFIQPLSLIIDTIGWQPYKKPSLKAFFKG